MKTVMKKLMSLLLVAVLLVSAVPFQASADTVDGEGNDPSTISNDTSDNETPSTVQVTIIYGSNSKTFNVNSGSALNDTQIGEVRGMIDSTVKGWSTNAGASSSDAAKLGTFTFDANTVLYGIKYAQCPCGIYENDTTTAHTDAACSLTPTTSLSCEQCGEIGHVIDTCPYCTECLKKGIKDPTHAAGNHCTTCGEVGHTPAAHCSDCGLVGNHTDTCITNCNGSASCNAKKHNTTCKTQTGLTITFRNSYSGVADDVRTGCGIGSSINAPGAAFVNGYTFRGWNVNGTLYGASAQIPVTAALDDAVISAVYEDTNPTATYKLNVWVRRIVGSTVRSTQLLTSCSTMQQNDNVLEWVSSNETSLRNMIAAQYPGYSWSGHVYNYYGEQVTATTTLLTTNGEKNIYFNLYGEENDVLVYIHTATSSAYDRLIEIDGYQTGEAISYNTVLSHVKQYYTGSNMTMKMYSDAGWTNKLNGKSDTDTYSIEVVEGTTKIHVKVYDAYSSSSSSSSTADSSNPKTGDEIFMAVTAMAVSASALALFFFYNKKRAAK